MGKYVNQPDMSTDILQAQMTRAVANELAEANRLMRIKLKVDVIALGLKSEITDRILGEVEDKA